MSLNRNLIVFDTETSGLDPENGCEVVHLCATAINYWDLEPHHAGTIELLIKPNRPDKAQKGALEVIGPLWDQSNKDGLDAKLAWQTFHDWIIKVNDGKKIITKPIIFAHNKDFDMKFTEFHMKEYGIVKKDEKWGWQFPWGFTFDSITLLWALFESDPNLSNLKLDTFLEKFGCQRANANIHNAREDVEKLALIVTRVLKFQREAFKRMKIGATPTKSS